MTIPLNCCHECKSVFFGGEEIYILPQKCICGRCFKYRYLRKMGGLTEKLIEEGSSFLRVTYEAALIEGSIAAVVIQET